MLIIARRSGERIIVDDRIVVTVLEISGQMVRIGIEAPREVSIYREELWQAVKQENEAAARGDLEALPRAPDGG
jgi:carbon storage regulator